MNKHGYSLLELMCCLGLLALCLSLSWGSWSQLSDRAMVRLRLQDLHQAIRLGRVLAETQGGEYRLMPLEGKNDWSWGVRLLKMPQEVLVAMWEWPQGRVQINWHGFNRSQWVVFSAALSHAHGNGHFVIHAASLEKTMFVNRIGTLRE